MMYTNGCNPTVFNKTELLWCATVRRQHQLPRSACRIGPMPSLRRRWKSTLTPTSVSGLTFNILVALQSRISSVFQTLVVVQTYLSSVICAQRCSSVNRRRSANITPASVHWLRASERIKFKLAVIIYRALHGTAPRYLSDQLSPVADMRSRSCLRSSTFNQLTVRPSRLVIVTVGERSFASAGPKLWNSLTDDITSASSLTVFRRTLITNLFRQSYPDIMQLVCGCSRHGGHSSSLLRPPQKM